MTSTGKVRDFIDYNSFAKSFRKSIENENVSYGEIAQLQGYKKQIIKNQDIDLAEWAGIDEDEFNR